MPFVAQQDKFLTELSDEINGLSEDHAIISSEIIPMLNGNAINELLDLFNGWQVKVIVYVRNIQSQSLSLASQAVKLMESRFSDDRLINIYTNHLRHFYSCYLQSLGLWATRIGKENLIFRKYGFAHFTAGSIYADILDALGMTITDKFILPEGLINESLIYCESIYFKDMYNRLQLEIDEEQVAQQLLAWERLHKGTKFFLPEDTSIRVEIFTNDINRFLIDNYLDDSYLDILGYHTTLNKRNDYELTYTTVNDILNYLDKHIYGFKQHFLNALIKALNRTYDYELELRHFEDIFIHTVENKTSVALWGCGDIADKLFKKHEFLRNTPLFIIDKNTAKQGSFFWGHKILPPSFIAEKSIDTIVIASVAYAEEITREIATQFPSVRYVIKLSDLTVNIGIECIDLKSDIGCNRVYFQEPGARVP